MISETTQATKIDRKELLEDYCFVDHLSSNENFLQESLELASRISGTKMAYISILDDKFQYILSQHGVELKTIKVEDSICQFTIKDNHVLVIDNTRENELTKHLPQVSKEGGVAFYAGCPLTNVDNINLGALCVMDTEVKSLTQTQQDTLNVLAKQIMTTFENQRIIENANKKLVDFANMVAHDVRAPLRTINSFIGLHDKELQKNSVSYKKDYLDFIKKAANNLDELTHGLLDYAKAGDHSFKNEKLKLHSILETVTFNLTETIKSSKAKVILPKDNFIITGKKLQLIQLFQNLISNSLKYQDGQKSPIVKVKADELNGKIRVSIIDNGIGISQENLDKIFEPFKRLHSSEEYKGSGIGLATCKKIIEKMGSQFFVSSELGKGSIFTFDLPK